MKYGDEEAKLYYEMQEMMKGQEPDESNRPPRDQRG